LIFLPFSISSMTRLKKLGLTDVPPKKWTQR
jgi:hypothetical protein